jgi:hypothetical protein
VSRVLVCLVASAALAHAAAPPAERPIPKAARHLLTANGWRVVDHAQIVPGTERNRAQSFHHRLYAGKVGSDVGRLVFEGRGTHGGPHVLTVRADGTVLLDVYPSRLVWVGPGDAAAHWGEGEPLRLPGVKGDMRLLEANGFGLVAAPPDLNTTVKVYFVPLAGRDPVVGKRVELVGREANSISRTRTGFHVSERWVLWGGVDAERRPKKGAGEAVVAFDGRTGKRWEVPVPEDAAVLGVEGDLAVTGRWKVVDRKHVGHADTFDLAARRRLTTYPAARGTRLLALRDGVGYFAAPMPEEIGKVGGRLRVSALDLLKERDPLLSQEVPPPPSSRTLQATRTGKGLAIGSDPPTLVEWAKRP